MLTALLAALALGALTPLALPTPASSTGAQRTPADARVAFQLPGTTTVAIRRSATLPAEAPVTLADIAAIDGPLSDHLGELTLADAVADLPASAPGSPWRVVAAARVRAALEAEPELNLGRIVLRGDTAHVRTAAPPAFHAPDPDRPEPAPVLPRANTVHAHAIAVLAATFDTPRHTMRIAFDPDDGALLATPTAGRTVEIRALATSERTPLAVSVYERDRIVASGTVTARVRLRREVVVASASINPDERITEDHAGTAVQWLAPDVRPAAPVAVFGAVARARLVPGSVVEVEDVTPPFAVRRGDRVQVHALARGVVVRMPGRVRADARPGETVEVQLIGRDRIVSARVETDGRVVLLVDEVSPESSAAFAGPPAPGRRTIERADETREGANR